jgi:hypothetical protein
MMILLIKSLVAYMFDSMAREFEKLDLDGHNYPTFALNVKISLAFWGILPALSPPMDREEAFSDTYKYQALFIIQNHLHPNLKSEYVMEEESHSLKVHYKAIMNSKRQSYCRRPTMSGLRFIFRTLSLLRTIIMLFIRSASNCDFVRKNH